MRFLILSATLLLQCHLLPSPGFADEGEVPSGHPQRLTLTPETVVDLDFKTPLTELDFGDLIPSKLYNLKFAVRNGSPRPVKITEVSTSCGCMTEEETGGEIHSGKRSHVLIRFNAPPLAGRLGKEAIVHYKDSTGSKSTHRILLVGNVNPRFWVNPGTLEFDSRTKSNDATRKLVIKADRREDFDLSLSVTASKGVLSVNNVSKTSAREWTVTVSRTGVPSAITDTKEFLVLNEGTEVVAALPLHIRFQTPNDVPPAGLLCAFL